MPGRFRGASCVRLQAVCLRPAKAATTDATLRVDHGAVDAIA